MASLKGKILLNKFRSVSDLVLITISLLGVLLGFHHCRQGFFSLLALLLNTKANYKSSKNTSFPGQECKKEEIYSCQDFKDLPEEEKNEAAARRRRFPGSPFLCPRFTTCISDSLLLPR